MFAESATALVIVSILNSRPIVHDFQGILHLRFRMYIVNWMVSRNKRRHSYCLWKMASFHFWRLLRSASPGQQMSNAFAYTIKKVMPET